MQASTGQQGEDMGSKATAFIKRIYPYAFMLIGFLSPLITIIVLSTNVGTPDSNQEIRKYVAISAPIIVVSMIFLAVGSWIYFSRQPEYIVYFAITAAIFAIGMSSFSLCISMIDKQIS